MSPPSQVLLKVLPGRAQGWIPTKPSATASQELVCPLDLCRWWCQQGGRSSVLPWKQAVLTLQVRPADSLVTPTPFLFQFPKARGRCQWVVKGKSVILASQAGSGIGWGHTFSLGKELGRFTVLAGGGWEVKEFCSDTCCHEDSPPLAPFSGARRGARIQKFN